MRQARKDRLVYLILAECRLILSEAKAPQPDQANGLKLLQRQQQADGVKGALRLHQRARTALWAGWALDA
jgi:hypothetical protein